MKLQSSKLKRIALRRIDVAKYFAQGMNQFQIAELVGVDRSVISRDLKILEQQWIQTANDEIAKHKAKELIKIDHMEQEAWESWEKSKKRKGIDTGNDKFLKVVQWCIGKRCELFGLYAPQKHEIAGAEGKTIDINITYNDN